MIEQVLIILFIIFLVYLFCNLVYSIILNICFGDQCAYMSLKELFFYKQSICLNGGGAFIHFDYEWGIIFTPWTYWYYIYLKIVEMIADIKYEKYNKVVPPWRKK